MQIKINDLRKRVQMLNRRVEANTTTEDIRNRILHQERVKEYEIDAFARYYIEYGRKLEAENMLYEKGIPGI